MIASMWFLKKKNIYKTIFEMSDEECKKNVIDGDIPNIRPKVDILTQYKWNQIPSPMHKKKKINNTDIRLCL